MPRRPDAPARRRPYHVSVKILIVDDIAAVRQELRQLLPLLGDVEVAGEAADGQAAIDQAQALQPDVVLMDLEMPGLGGCEATRQIKARRPACRVVVLTVHGGPAEQQKASQAGADAFVVKGGPIEALVKAIMGGTQDD
jgi:DNA-binding NarL/FixJ family response regulator